MQLKRPKSVRGTLAAATCTLLGNSVANPVSAELQDWEFDTALLYYKEENRVTVVEPVIDARKELGDDEFVDIRLVLDALSGASPNGAVPADHAQTFSGPSGNNSYTVDANQTPLDPTFEDVRGAASVSWERPLSTDLTSTLGANFSREYDYTSVGISGTLSREINNKHTTLTGGVAVNYDSISPVGGAPDPLSEVNTVANSGGEDEDEDDDDHEGGGSGKSKTVTDLMFGVTQIINRNTLMQMNYSYGKSSGYLTDPYKLISVIKADNSGDLAPGNNGNDYLYLYESRPDLRIRQSLYWKLNHQFTDDVAYLTYRYFWDDWGITSHTVDLRYRYELSHKHYLQPHLRYYRQTAADFYRYFLVSGDTPDNVSADYRLGEFTTVTIGLLYGVELSDDSEFSIRVEQMTQSGESNPDEAVGKLRDYDLFPDVKATIVQLSYRHKF